jgi:rhamnosyltransferase
MEARDAVLDHRYGQPTRHRLGWMRPLVTNHAAVRRYYQARNRLVVYRDYARFDPRWLVADLREFLRDTAKIVCFEQQRAAKLVAILRGGWDGWRGRMGPAGT